MYFKGSVWNLLRQQSEIFNAESEGLWGFYCFDSYLQKILLNRMGAGARFSVLWGEELSFDWFRENIIQAGLFSSNKCYLVYNAERLDAGVRKIMMEQAGWSGRAMVLCFSKKDKFFDELTKFSQVKCLHIEPPRFWEGEKLLSFLCEQMRIPLDQKVKGYLLDAIPHNISDFVHTLKFLSLNAPERGELSIQEVEKLIDSKELNRFQLADLLSLKNFKEFYSILVEKKADFNTYRSLFAFMQTHLLKLGEPSYIEKKARLSQYDRGILSYAKNWSTDEIRIQLRRMGDWEIRAKRRDPFLFPLLRSKFVSFR